MLGMGIKDFPKGGEPKKRGNYLERGDKYPLQTIVHLFLSVFISWAFLAVSLIRTGSLVIEAIDEGNALYEIISRKGAKISEAQNVKKSRLVHGQELLPEDPCCRCVWHCTFRQWRICQRGFHKGPSSLDITTKKTQTRNSRKKSSVIQIAIS